MSDKFKAIVLNQSGELFSREVKTLDKSFLSSADVLIKIDYSHLNFKDSYDEARNFILSGKPFNHLKLLQNVC